MAEKRKKNPDHALLQDYRILKMRVEGLTYAEIAEELKISMAEVLQACRRAAKPLIDHTRKAAEEFREVENLRLDGILAAHWPARHEPRHADVLIKAMERRARLLGLDMQPEKEKEDAAEALRNFLTGAQAATGLGAKED